MAVMIPQTTPDTYLTGTAALSIPTEEGDVADWHFDAAFLREGTRFRVAGANFPSTSNLLGRFGIRECADVLRARAVPLPTNQHFYAATYPRAVLDLLLTTTAEHKEPAFLQASDMLEEGDLQLVLDQLDTVRTRITDRIQQTLIDQWIDEQRLSANI
jgi:hypothetical protein